MTNFTNPNALSSRWPEMVGLAWADEDFRQTLLNDPDRAIQALGIETLGAGRIRVVEEAPGETLLVVPRRPEHLAAMSAHELNNEKWICTTGDCFADKSKDADPEAEPYEKTEDEDEEDEA